MSKTDSPGRQPRPPTPHAHTPYPKRWALPTPTLLQIVLFAGIFLLNFFMVTDPDLWWHLATGRYIVETGAIPRADPFSYTAGGQPWVAHEWLAEILMYLLYRPGGYLVPVIFFAALITLTFLTVFRTLRLLGLRVVGATCITFWVAVMSLAGWNVRPQVFSYLFFALYLYLLLRARERIDRWLWLLPALMAVWVNLHAGYVMGLMLLGTFLFGEGIRWVGGKATGNRQQATGDGGTEKLPLPLGEGRGEGSSHHSPQFSLLSRTGLAVAGATAAATAANPQGLGMLLYPLTYAGTQNASMRYIAEWQSPNFHDYFFFVFGASMMALMVARGRRAVDWSLAVPLLVLTAMSLQSARVIPFYALAAAPMLGIRLASPRATSLSTHHSHATVWNWVLLPLCLAVMASTLYLSDRAQLGPEPRTTEYPAAGARYLREAGLPGNLFNTYHWGGFLIWSFYPERKAYVDGRADMYGDRFVERYKKSYNGRSEWREVLDEHQIEVALIEKGSPLATVLAASKEWDEVFRGEVESVYVRTHPEGQGIGR